MVNTSQRKASVAILLIKVDFRARNITRDREDHFIMKIRLIHLEAI